MKGKVICDSSVIIKWLSSQDELRLDKANAIINDAEKGNIEIFTPELAKYEVGNALLTGKHYTIQDAKTSLATLYSLPVKFVSESAVQAEETYKIGEKSKITYYDACFVSLAKLLNAVLVTDNPKHQAKIKDIKVISLKDYR
ncbi:MAG: hypothetical protein ACD_57C00145G0003 [uncultured bacterium]|uniref:PIN domain-containing protein n=1 Tax=Candidatus Curtissbacteria bacterium RIFOXYA1_FULL_41_14 TaxID=1797737 RepID=A0A1F5HCI9_9BACT|nr:MAG: hypothetical protein ACD_57C00145G0003 [uncultured bacterium]KKR56996.1 MAG: hypothetical protein UT95_C0029G0004 [Candidatus Curtissbacteria bacterium GW2011_GWB1_40_28]KKR60698.1 MAG: hypothetical protein UT99_C0009G0014 [Candidatus Curtissbacteria bacterium GW2011_GWA2_40_31]KKR61062.1 MAG: hypothetical protein UU00_C0021G0004 [Microgenomates group bacterium GW2011_GWC1_40_35]KKR74712.1 MAG: hypothetical protein UU19_C0073G0006 [Candidatus Curtissbacteria bacterium GW2011_GWD1_40_8]